jgi:methylated-DNA-[protein]-cysteine S-methyltransferase
MLLLQSSFRRLKNQHRQFVADVDEVFYLIPMNKLNLESPETFQTCWESPLGFIKITGTRDSVLALDFVEAFQNGDHELPFCIKECIKQIAEYFDGKRKEFFLHLDPQGTTFQKLVWRQLEKIPFGKLVSYGEVARAIGKPEAFRAVGSANGKNPIAIIIPCHRVIGSDGSLTGYGGGLWRKEWLIAHERGYSPDNIIA